MGVTRAERRGFEAAAFAGSGCIGDNRRHRRAGTRSSRFAVALGQKTEIRHCESLCGRITGRQASIEGAIAEIDPSSLEFLLVGIQKP
jgi:hypothetical protein